MNLLAVFCYITVTCDPPTATKQATIAAPAAAVALPQVRSPSVTATRNLVAPLSVDGGGRPQQQLLQQEPQRQEQQLQQQKQRSKPVVRETEVSTYPTRYDYIDVEAVMNNERIIKILFNCVLNRGPCTREGLELKRIIPDAIQTECSKCNEQQRKQAGKALAHLLTYKPEYWKALVQKFDPNNVYLRRFMADDDEEEISTTSKTTNDTIIKKN